MQEDTSVRVKHNTCKELNILKHTEELHTLDNTIQFLINKYQLKKTRRGKQ